jgi:hypothetical protein
MNILFKSKKIILGSFTDTQSDFSRINRSVFYFEHIHCPVSNHPLAFDLGRGYFTTLLSRIEFSNMRKKNYIRVFLNNKGRDWAGNIEITFPYKTEPRQALLYRYNIFPWFQGKGLGTAALSAIKSMVMAEKTIAFDGITAGVWPDNTASIRAFKRAGWQDLGVTVKKRDHTIGKGVRVFQIQN